ncbi:MAG: hypothetical protein J6C93_07030 [Clostridia bacterium]|nr:hypothetical protein [Clostridia bacterium]
MKGKLMLAGSLVLAAAMTSSVALTAAAARVDEDGVTQYGWTLMCPATDEILWEFDEDGNVAASYAAEGDIANHFTNNYAMRDIEFAANEAYTVQATFTPEAEQDLSTERSYGIVCWYADSNNYILYWLQQKTDGGWSGQFYGKVDNAIKAVASDTHYGTGGWSTSEWNDMWWDAGKNHEAINGTRSALLTTTVGLKVESEIKTVSVGGTETSCRAFKITQTVNGTDKVVDTFYCRDITAESDPARVGIYTHSFSVGISNLSIVGANDAQRAAAVDTAVNAIGTVDAAEDIRAVVDARIAYETLLGLQAQCAADTASKLETAENSVGTYVDGLIIALDSTSATFADDVDAVYELYTSLNDTLAAKVTKTQELADALDLAQNPPAPPAEEDPTDPPADEDPTDPPADEDPTDPPADEDPTDPPAQEPTDDPEEEGGCGSVVIGGVSAAIVALGAGAVVFARKRK